VRKDSQGTSYTANLDGTDAPYDGCPGVTVSVKVMGGRTLVQKDKYDGKVFSVERFTVDEEMLALARVSWNQSAILIEVIVNCSSVPVCESSICTAPSCIESKSSILTRSRKLTLLNTFVFPGPVAGRKSIVPSGYSVPSTVA
jgi:hypothetical protein